MITKKIKHLLQPVEKGKVFSLMCFCFNKEKKKGWKKCLMYQNWVKNRHRKADVKSCQQIPKFSTHFPKCEAAKTQQRGKNTVQKTESCYLGQPV